MRLQEGHSPSQRRVVVAVKACHSRTHGPRSKRCTSWHASQHWKGTYQEAMRSSCSICMGSPGSLQRSPSDGRSEGEDTKRQYAEEEGSQKLKLHRRKARSDEDVGGGGSNRRLREAQHKRACNRGFVVRRQQSTGRSQRRSRARRETES